MCVCVSVCVCVYGGWGGGGGGRGRSTYSLEIFSAFSLVSQNQNCLCSLLPKITFVFPVSFIFRLLFPCSLEISDIIPLFPITPWEGLIYLFILIWSLWSIYNHKSSCILFIYLFIYLFLSSVIYLFLSCVFNL